MFLNGFSFLTANQAGLFTSALVGFNVAYYPTVMAGSSQTSANGSVPQTSDLAINALWFTSLALTLTSASVGIVAKQWLDEYRKGNWRNAKNRLQVRQYRIQGMEAWRVVGIIHLQSPLLQVALLLFVVGLLILLWKLHVVIAIIPTVCFCIWWTFWFASTVLPTFFPSCPYRSPEAFLFFHLWQRGTNLLRALLRRGFLPVWLRTSSMKSSSSPDHLHLISCLPICHRRQPTPYIDSVLWPLQSLNTRLRSAFPREEDRLESFQEREKQALMDADCPSELQILESPGLDRTVIDGPLVLSLSLSIIDRMRDLPSVISHLARRLRCDIKKFRTSYPHSMPFIDDTIRQDQITRRLLKVALQLLRDRNSEEHQDWNVYCPALLVLGHKWFQPLSPESDGNVAVQDVYSDPQAVPVPPDDKLLTDDLYECFVDFVIYCIDLPNIVIASETAYALLTFVYSKLLPTAMSPGEPFFLTETDLPY